MAITIQEIKKVLHENGGESLSTIAKARNHENRVKLHTQTILDDRDNSEAFNDFLEFVRLLSRPDKFQMFLTLMRFPVATVALTDKIFTALEKVFDGRDPVFKYVFNSPNDADDWEWYRTRVLKSFDLWKTKGFQQMKTAINSVVIVDLPAEQTTEKPEPYFYFLPIRKVIRMKMVDETQLDWIIFHQDDGRIAVFDDAHFRVFKTKNGSLIEIEDTPELENPHDLGYCPARMFWTTPINNDQPLVKKAPVSNYLGALDLILYYSVANEHLGTYARFPIYWGFASDCDYNEQTTGTHCHRGYLRHRTGAYLLAGDSPKPCPICAKKRLVGPGSFMEIDPPNEANEGANLRDPAGFVAIPKDDLEFNANDVLSRENRVFQAITGYQGMPMDKEAINESQVLAVFEGMERALNGPQMNFEMVMGWTESTICRLRYSERSFVSASVSLGTRHYIMPAAELLKIYELAKKNSFSVQTLDMFEDRYYETEFRNNPEEIERHKLQSHIDPFRHLSIGEVTAMYEANQISYVDYMMKKNFSSLIMQFERENLPITEFGITLDFNTRVKNIREGLRGLALQMQPEQTEPDPVEEPGMV